MREGFGPVLGDDELQETSTDKGAGAPSQNRFDRIADEHDAAVDADLQDHVGDTAEQLRRSRVLGVAGDSLGRHEAYPGTPTGKQ